MLLDPVQVLVGPGQAVKKQSAVLIRNRRLEAFGDEARRRGQSEGLEPQEAGHQLLAHAWWIATPNSRNRSTAGEKL